MPEQTILAFSGKKQSGKNTSYSCLRLWRAEAQEFSFADSLKRVCIDVLGLEEWQAYGTDTEKNSLVPHLLWENFPVTVLKSGHIVDPVDSCMDSCIAKGLLGDAVEEGYEPRTGPMTAREVLQYWGTEIFRKQYNQVWADACIRKIRKSQCKLAVITDCRFPNELEAVQNAGGKVIRLTRNVFPNDKHPSETALDAEVFDHSRFDAVLDNAELELTEQCEELYGLLRRWDIVSAKTVKRFHV